MEKRVLVAIFLSFLVLYVYQALFAPPTHRSPPAAPSGRHDTSSKPRTRRRTSPSRWFRRARRSRQRRHVLGEASERDIRIETAERHRRLHESGRPPQELAIEEVSGPQRRSRSSSSRTTLAMPNRCRFRCDVAQDGACTQHVEQRALCRQRCAVRGGTDHRRRRQSGSSTATAPACRPSRNSSSTRPRTWSRSTRQ